MATFEPSPRPPKRRKTVSNEITPPVYSRVLRTVKQAVYGKPSSPKVSGEVLYEGVTAPIANKSPPGKRSGKPNEANQTALSSKLRPRSTKHVVDDKVGDGDLPDVSPKRSSGRFHSRGGKSTSPNTGDGRNTEAVQTPTGKKKRKYKGGVYVGDKVEYAQDEVSGDAMERDTRVGRLRKGHEDLTIDMNPEQLQFRVSHNKADGLDEDAVDPTIGRARRRSKRTEDNEDAASSARGVPKPASQRKKGSQKIRHDTLPTPLADEGVEQDIGNTSGENALPDELANVFREEESKQEPEVQTPNGRLKQKTQDVRRSTTPTRSRHVEDGLSLETQEVIISDSQIPMSDHAQALQLVFQKHPDGLEMLKAHVISGLTGKRRLPLTNLQDEHQKVKQLVEQTVLAGEGNSMLVIGSRGSGKTLLVETVIAELSSDHGNDFHVVRLNGFIHTDDKLALREIWRQLGREMEVENDDLGGRSNYADTMTSLLALLAHPATEDTGEDQAATARSVVFILDEFDLFTSHPRQTLLYNLFDVAQSRNAPIAVLGLTTKVNVVDCLEKRVKSRFGQRYLHLSLPKAFAAFQNVCLSALKCRPSTQELLQDKSGNSQQISTAWNKYTESLFETQQLQHFLQTLYTTTKSVPAFLNASLLPISSLSPTTIPSPSSFTSNALTPPDSKLHLIPSLSTLSLSLLIAAARLGIILSTDVCTFSMVYDEYVTLASKSKMQSSAAGQMAIGGGARVWSRELAKGAWEELGDLELILPAVGGGGRGGVGRGEMWRVDVGLEEIGGVLEREAGKGGALGKWCREI